MMLRNETWMVALEALWANKIRAYLTTLGVIIGSACIVLVVTVALSGRRYIIQQIESVGTNIVFAHLDADPGRQIMLQDELSVEDMNAAKAMMPGVVAVAGTRSYTATVDAGGVERSVSLVGVTEGFQQIRNLLILQGRFLDAEDDASRSRVCLITSQLANFVFPFTNAIGHSLHVGELSFTIIGVFKRARGNYGQSEGQKLLDSYSLSVDEKLPGRFIPGRVLRAGCNARGRNPDDPAIGSAAGQPPHNAHTLLGGKFWIHPGHDSEDCAGPHHRAPACGIHYPYGQRHWNNEHHAGHGPGAYVREIGIRKAIGARHGEILYQFLLEAFLISGFGSVLGILIAVAIPVIARPWLPSNISVSVPWEAVVLAFLVSCSVGVFFGYLPAERASQLQPTESLRYE